MALETLSKYFKVSGKDMAMGLKTTVWPARFQRLNTGPLVDMLPDGWQLWLDGGHNEACALAIASEIKSWRNAGDDCPVHLIFGMLNSKEAETFLKPLADVSASISTVTIPGEENALSAEVLTETAHASGHKNVTSQSDVTTALQDVIAEHSGIARVLICGSLYLAGTILSENG
jgi:dihydrofolate synthase/folylpolyglutamate synthase